MKDFTKSTFSFVQKFKIFRYHLLILAGIGLACFACYCFSAQVRSIFDTEFVGGVSTTYDLGVTVDSGVTDNIRQITSQTTGFQAASVQVQADRFQRHRRLGQTLEMDSETRDAVFNADLEAYPNAQAGETTYISASVGDDLKAAAVSGIPVGNCTDPDLYHDPL